MAGSVADESTDALAKKKRRDGPRTPSRGRGVIRHAALLDATEDLLMSLDPDAIGLYQIAEKAEIPPASVYHFFPTKEAAYVALARRYLEGLLEMHREPIEARLIKDWPDLLMIDMRRGMEFYNARPPMSKILYGGYGGVEARVIDGLAVSRMSNAHYHRLDKLFHMPFIRHPERISEFRMSILDAIWTLSVRRHGSITEEYLIEAHRACVAYSSFYLPQHLEPREYLLEAAAAGGTVHVPFDDGTDGLGD